MHSSKCEPEHTLCCLFIPPDRVGGAIKLKEVNYTRNNTNNRNNDDKAKWHVFFFLLQKSRQDNKPHINKLRWSERPSILPTTCRRSHRYSSSDSFTACFTNSLVSHTTCCTQAKGALLIHKMNTASRCTLGRWPAKCYPKWGLAQY